VSHIDANHRNVKMLGCSRVVKSHTDVEPVILVPIDSMHEVKTSEELLDEEPRELWPQGEMAPA
jgi:hypothetical protein